MSERKKEMNDIKELSSFLSNLNKNILKINNQLNKTSIKINKTNTNFKNNNNNKKKDEEILFPMNKKEIKKVKTRNNSISLNFDRDFTQSFVQKKKRNSGILDNSIKEMSDLINRTQQDLLSKNIIGENINKGKINPVLRHKPSASSLSSARVTNLNINKIFDNVKDNNNNEKKKDNITVNIRHVKTDNYEKNNFNYKNYNINTLNNINNQINSINNDFNDNDNSPNKDEKKIILNTDSNISPVSKINNPILSEKKDFIYIKKNLFKINNNNNIKENLKTEDNITSTNNNNKNIINSNNKTISNLLKKLKPNKKADKINSLRLSREPSINRKNSHKTSLSFFKYSNNNTLSNNFRKNRNSLNNINFNNNDFKRNLSTLRNNSKTHTTTNIFNGLKSNNFLYKKKKFSNTTSKLKNKIMSFKKEKFSKITNIKYLNKTNRNEIFNIYEDLNILSNNKFIYSIEANDNNNYFNNYNNTIINNINSNIINNNQKNINTNNNNDTKNNNINNNENKNNVINNDIKENNKNIDTKKDIIDNDNNSDINNNDNNNDKNINDNNNKNNNDINNINNNNEVNNNDVDINKSENINNIDNNNIENNNNNDNNINKSNNEINDNNINNINNNNDNEIDLEKQNNFALKIQNKFRKIYIKKNITKNFIMPPNFDIEKIKNINDLILLSKMSIYNNLIKNDRNFKDLINTFSKINDIYSKCLKNKKFIELKNLLTKNNNNNNNNKLSELITYDIKNKTNKTKNKNILSLIRK